MTLYLTISRVQIVAGEIIYVCSGSGSGEDWDWDEWELYDLLRRKFARSGKV